MYKQRRSPYIKKNAMQGIDPASPSSYSQRHVTPTVASKKWNVPLYLQPQPTFPYLITELRSLWLSKKNGSNSSQNR